MSKDVNDKKAWEAAFIKPIAKVMKDRGIAYLLITLRDDGKAAYVMEPMEEECPHNMGHELNGVGMWICLGCRADITPELSPSKRQYGGTERMSAKSPKDVVEVASHDLLAVAEILDAFDYESDEDSCMGMSFFTARLNEDSFFHIKWKLEAILKSSANK